MTKEEALALTADIINSARGIVDLVCRAYSGRIWIPLGYDSWETYCRAELDVPGLRVARAERPGLVQSLRDAGLSSNAISVVTGVPRRTIRRDLSGGSNPEISVVLGMNGKRYAVHTPAESDSESPSATQPAPGRAGGSVVYFVRARTGHVKIGYSASPVVRMNQLRNGSPVSLELLGVVPGDSTTEAEFHARLVGSWSHGEWFNPTNEVLAFIADTLG